MDLNSSLNPPFEESSESLGEERGVRVEKDISCFTFGLAKAKDRLKARIERKRSKRQITVVKTNPELKNKAKWQGSE